MSVRESYIERRATTRTSAARKELTVPLFTFPNVHFEQEHLPRLLGCGHEGLCSFWSLIFKSSNAYQPQPRRCRMRLLLLHVCGAFNIGISTLNDAAE